jgi:hypothetical protein
VFAATYPLLNTNLRVFSPRGVVRVVVNVSVLPETL